VLFRSKIARGFIEGELKSIAQKDTKDDMIKQIIGMSSSDAKIDGIVETISTIKQTDSSKVKFIRDLFDSRITSSSDFQSRLNQRGRRNLTNGQENEYYEPEVGYVRDEILKYVQEKRNLRK
jgi:hypothetical protein